MSSERANEFHAALVNAHLNCYRGNLKNCMGLDHVRNLHQLQTNFLQTLLFTGLVTATSSPFHGSCDSLPKALQNGLHGLDESKVIACFTCNNSMWSYNSPEELNNCLSIASESTKAPGSSKEATSPNQLLFLTTTIMIALKI